MKLFRLNDDKILTSSDTGDVLDIGSLHGDPHVSVVLVYVGGEVEGGRAGPGDAAFVCVSGAPGLAQRTPSTVVVPASDSQCEEELTTVILTLSEECRPPLRTGRCRLCCE